MRIAAIRNFRAHIKSLTTVELYWETEPHSLNAPYELYRANAQGEAYEMVGNGQGNAFVDTLAYGAHRDSLVYRVKVGDLSAEARVGRQADAWLLALADEYLWQLRSAGNSTISVAYCIRRENSNCPECFSTELNKRIKASCDTCDGSGKLSSFTGPIPMRYAPVSLERNQATMGDVESEIEIVSGWTGNTPMLRIGDIIITKEHAKYKVHAIPSVSIMHSVIDGKEFLLRQWITLRKLNDDEYPMLAYHGNEVDNR
jgi:hypothetical protein